MQHKILHRIPGRIRVRMYRLKHDLVFQEKVVSFFLTLAGVRAVGVNPACASLTLEFDSSLFFPEETLARISESEIIQATIQPKKLPAKNRFNNWVEKLEAPPIVQLGLGALSLASAVFGFPPALTRTVLALATAPIFGRGLRVFLEEGRPAVEFMDAASLIVLTVESAYMPASVMVFLIGIGEYIRDFAAQKSESMQDELLKLSQGSAWLVQNERRERVSISKLNIGDSIVVYTGERIPVRCRIEEGTATIVKAKSSLNKLPIQVGPGDEISAGAIIIDGKLYLTCISAKPKSQLSRALERERIRALYRTSYQRHALKKAYKIVNPIMLVSAFSFLLSRNVVQAFTIICFDFVTGVRIALPTSILSYMYNAGRNGVLIKAGSALEKLSEMDIVIFARSGVINVGDSEITSVLPLTDASADEILSAAAAVEYRYHHPAARAIYRYAQKRQLQISERRNSEFHPGLGVKALVDGRNVLVGSKRFMLDQEIDIESSEQSATEIKDRGDSVAYIAIEKELVGLIAYRDQIKEEGAAVLRELKQLGIKETILISGDSGNQVRRLSNSIETDKFYTGLSPEAKADLVRSLQVNGLRVAVVGDEVSDALAMAQADLSIALNSSTDIAKYRADIIFSDDNIKHLPASIELSRKSMSFLRQNMFAVSIPNWLGLILSLTNIVGPVNATILNNGSVILAALNGLLPALRRTEAADTPILVEDFSTSS